MARAVWTGSLSFGLVNVPVALFSATEERSIRFNQFQAGTSDRIRNKRVNERTGEEVATQDIAKGTHLGGGEYVVLFRRDRISGTGPLQDDRRLGLRGPRRDRPGVLRPVVLPGASRQGCGEGIRARVRVAARSDAARGQRRVGHLRHARAASARRDPATRRRPRPRDAPRLRRGPRPRRGDRDAADRREGEEVRSSGPPGRGEAEEQGVLSRPCARSVTGEGTDGREVARPGGRR